MWLLAGFEMVAGFSHTRLTQSLSGICIRHRVNERSPVFKFAAEQNLARDLRTVLRDVEIGSHLPETEELRAAMSSLENFIPEVLREIHPEWKHESLDAVFPECCIKTNELEIEIFGTCIVISDQTMVPTHTQIRVSATENAIESMQCKLGELVGQTMKRVADGGNHGCRLSVATRKDTIEWAYHVAFRLPEDSREH